MFSLAISLLILAQAAPASGPADAGTPSVQSVPSVQTAPAVPDAPAPSPAAEVTRPTTQALPGAMASGASAGTTVPSAGSAAAAGPATSPPATGPSAAATQPTEVPWLAKVISQVQLPVLLLVVLGLMMFFQIRNKRNQEKATKERLGSIKRGDRVQTIGGILGNVVQSEEKRILVKVDESNNTKIWFARDAIRGVIEEDKPDAKPGK